MKYSETFLSSPIYKKRINNAQTKFDLICFRDVDRTFAKNDLQLK